VGVGAREPQIGCWKAIGKLDIGLSVAVKQFVELGLYMPGHVAEVGNVSFDLFLFHLNPQ